MNILNKIQGDIPMGDSWKELSQILDYPDEQFEAIYPEFRAKLEKVFNSPSFQQELLSEVHLLDVEDIDQERAEFQAFLQIVRDDHSENEHKKELLLYLLENTTEKLYELALNPRQRIEVTIEKINDNAKIPEYAHPSDAGCDVFSAEAVTINANETKIVKTGIRVAIPAGYEIQIRPRSGLSAKTGLRVANAPGTIDSMYRGEIGVILHNTSSEPYTVEIGDKIAQMVIAQSPMIKWVENKIDTDTDRGEGGFGSTGN